MYGTILSPVHFLLVVFIGVLFILDCLLFVGSVTINSSRSHPPQQGQGQGAGMPLSSQSHQHHQQVVGNQETTGHGRSQPHHHHAHHHSQQQPVSAMSVTPPSQPTDSVQSVQRLLSHGRYGIAPLIITIIAYTQVKGT